MKQAIMIKPGQIEYRDVKKPEIGPDEVRIKIKRIGVCGSDIHVYHGKHPYTSYPIVQGHEFSGVIDAVGTNVMHLKHGMKTTATPQITCGKCGPCQRGDYHICDNLKVQGFQASGVAQEYFVTESKKVVILSDSFSFEMGAFVEPLAVGIHVVNRVNSVKDKNVAVLGAGTIGNLVAQTVKAKDGNVIITDLSDYRLKIAYECGIKNTVNINTNSFSDAIKKYYGSKGVDIIFECVGAEQTIADAIENIQKGGSIVIVGVFSEKPRVDLGLIQDHELKLIGTLMYKYDDYIEAVNLIIDGNILTEPLDSKHFSFTDYKKAYQFIDKQKDQCMKVFIDMD
jgi:L-iditol 2-dehydrogenase